MCNQANACTSCKKFKYAFSRLTTTQQAALKLRWECNFSYEQVGQTLYMAEGVVQARGEAAIGQLHLMLPCLKKQGVRQQLLDAIATLPPIQQTIVNMEIYDKMSKQDIAEALCMTIEETVLEWSAAMNTLRTTLPTDVLNKMQNNVTCKGGDE